MPRAIVLFVYFIFCVELKYCVGSDESKIVVLADGAVKGDKYWNGEHYEFYGIPYAKAPTGRDKFQAPLPPEPWQGVLEASKKTMCKQCYISGVSGEDILVDGDEDCLVINLLVPQIASETNLVPVVVYIHSGAFSGGSSTMANFHYVARHDVIAISFNYRLGAFGFACLGNKEIPGNAGLKDQVAALRWIKKNIRKFGGNPNKVTLAGFSVGATMAELLSLSKATTGLFDKIILDSGSALAPFAINRDPIGTAKNIAISLGYNGTMTLEGLTEFYLNASAEGLAEKSVNYYLTNSTFGFAPCIENVLEGIEPILTESPLDILKKGENNDVAVLTGFADMEGLSRSIKFGEWREKMNENFSDFLPADLVFDSEKLRDDFVKEVKKYYFDDKPVSAEALQKYVDYFSDSMFKYNIIKSAKLHAARNKSPVYLYEFSYTGKLNIEHNYMDRIKGASHRDQTAYILDFFGFTNNYKDLDTRERLTTMWTDFVKYGNPTAFESSLITTNWLPYSNNRGHYMEINKKLQLKKDLFKAGFDFWNKVYEKYYWTPLPPLFVEYRTKDIKDVNQPEISKVKNTSKEKERVTEKKHTNDLKKENESPEEIDTLKKVSTLEEIDPKKAKNTKNKQNTPNKNKTGKEQSVGKEKNITKVKNTKENENSRKDNPTENTKIKDTLNKKISTKIKSTTEENEIAKENFIKKETYREEEHTLKYKDSEAKKYSCKENNTQKDALKESGNTSAKDINKDNNTNEKESPKPKIKETTKEDETPKERKKK